MSSIAFSPASLVDITVHGESVTGIETVLTDDALAFLATLTRIFKPRIEELFHRRHARRAELASGVPLDFLPHTASIRAAEWTVAPVPERLLKRTVEIIGPVDQKTIADGLKAGADVFTADFEDSTSPTWENLISGQRYLMEAVRGTLGRDAETGSRNRLAGRTAALFVRPRGLHLPERHVTVDGEPVPGALFDFGLFFFHNVHAQLERGAGPWFYLPKLESHLEARFWNEVFVFSEATMGVPRGSVRATALIDTLPAAFEMDEILYELRDRSAGLACGGWDYVSSIVKTRRHEPGAVLPDRLQVSMKQPCMRAYTQLMVRTCHRRGAQSIGGMASQIPIKDDPPANVAAFERVRADTLREVFEGHVGTRVTHPRLVPVARAVFDLHGVGPNQFAGPSDDPEQGVRAVDLLRVPAGTRTEEGLRLNVRIGIQYIESWLRGNGRVSLHHQMEDAATAEISRVQVWQWLRHRATLENGRPITVELFHNSVAREMERIGREVGEERIVSGRYIEARDLFIRLCLAEECAEFLTLDAYQMLESSEEQGSPRRVNLPRGAPA